MTVEACPICRLKLGGIGRLIAYRDDAGQHFVFACCPRCSASLSKLPIPTQQKRLEGALRTLAAHPERYFLRFFADADEAKLYVTLEAERLAKESRAV